MTPKASFRQSAWLEWINQSLYFRVPWRKRRQIIQELRVNLAIATEEVGPDEALRQFGPAGELVKSYLDNDRGRFDLASAIVSAMSVLLAWLVVGGLVWLVAWQTHDALAPSADLTHSFFGIYSVQISGDSGSTFETSFGMSSPVVVLAVLVAFLVGGRFWHLFTRSER